MRNHHITAETYEKKLFSKQKTYQHLEENLKMHKKISLAHQYTNASKIQRKTNIYSQKSVRQKPSLCIIPLKRRKAFRVYPANELSLITYRIVLQASQAHEMIFQNQT